MPKPEFGKKVICNNCEAKFYDLNRKPAICPHCGTEYVEPTNEVLTTSAKQVFVDQVDIVTDDNLVGSDATESIAEDAEIELEEQIDDDTISLEDSEAEDGAISSDVDIELDGSESTEDIDRE
ncbi:MAG: TIGR02300 family protein [Candidatus Pelagibacterales bacterium]|tara:strand:+ start:115 stop:483 length:369 start_codon:yes stop_codon:yes gene_type:complete